MTKYKRRTKTDLIVIHCSATKPNHDVDTQEIRRWHVQRGFIDVGYHFIIRLDGSLEFGRPEDVRGAHCKGHNWRSIGICLVGGLDDEGEPANTYNDAQLITLRSLVKDLQARFDVTDVKGHNELDSGKACPCATVEELLDGLLPTKDSPTPSEA